MPSISPEMRQGTPARLDTPSSSQMARISSAIAFAGSFSGTATSGLSGQRCIIDWSGVVTLRSRAWSIDRDIDLLDVSCKV